MLMATRRVSPEQFLASGLAAPRQMRWLPGAANLPIRAQALALEASLATLQWGQAEAGL